MKDSGTLGNLITHYEVDALSATRNKKLPSDLLTVRQVAARFNVHPNTVRRWDQQGILTSCRIGPGNHRRFYRSEVERLLQSGSRSESVVRIHSPEAEAIEPAIMAGGGP